MRAQYTALLALFLDSVAYTARADVLEVERIEKRAENTTVIPAPINIEPSQYWDGNDGPWYVWSRRLLGRIMTDELGSGRRLLCNWAHRSKMSAS